MIWFLLLLFGFLVGGVFLPGDPVLPVGPGREVDQSAPFRAEGAVGISFPGRILAAPGTSHGFQVSHWQASRKRFMGNCLDKGQPPQPRPLQSVPPLRALTGCATKSTQCRFRLGSQWRLLAGARSPLGLSFHSRDRGGCPSEKSEQPRKNPGMSASRGRSSRMFRNGIL